MTVQYVVPPVNAYNGDGATTVFNYTFQVANISTDLFVYFVVNQIPVLQTTGFIITPNTSSNNGAPPYTGSVTFTSAPPSGTIVRLVRNTYEQRLTNYVTGPLIPGTLNADIDNTVLMIQDLDGQLVPQDGAGNWNFGGALLRNVGTPIEAGDAATMGYVDAIAAGTQPVTALLLQGTNTLTSTLQFNNYPTGQVIFNNTPYIPTVTNPQAVVFKNTNVYNNTTDYYGSGGVLFDYSGATDSNQVHVFIATNVSSTTIGNTAWLELQNYAGVAGKNPNFLSTVPIGGSVEMTAVNYSVGALNTVTISNAGTSYIQGTYTNVPLTTSSGFGVGASATIVINSGGNVASITVNGSPTVSPGFNTGGSGAGYSPTDTLTAANTYLGGSGSGFVGAVNQVTSYNGKMKCGVRSATTGGNTISFAGYDYMSNRRSSLSPQGANTGFEQQFKIYPLDLIGTGTISSLGNQVSIVPVYNFGVPGGITYINAFQAATIFFQGQTTAQTQTVSVAGNSTTTTRSNDGTHNAIFQAQANFITPGTGAAQLNLLVDNTSGNASGWQVYTNGQTGATAGTLYFQQAVAGSYTQYMSLTGTGVLSLSGPANPQTVYTSTGTNKPSISVGVNDTNNNFIVYDMKNSVPLLTIASNQGAAAINTTGLKVSGPIGVNGATPPTQVTGFGSPTGASILTNFPGGTATLAQCSAAIAEIYTILKSLGIIGA